MFHGNGEIAQDYGFIVEKILFYGLNLAIMDYRGYGWSDEDPTFYHLLKDSSIIYDYFIKWLKEEGYSQNIIIFGRSLGSAAAAEIGGGNPPEVLGYIFESGFANTFKLFGSLFGIQIPGLTEKIIDKWTNKTKIKKINKPILVIHGDRDNIVPYKQGKSIYESAINNPNV